MNQQKDLKYFMKLNYNVILKRKDSYYYLFIPELSIIVEDKDLDIAYKKLEEEKVLYFKKAKELDVLDTVKNPISLVATKTLFGDLSAFFVKVCLVALIILITIFASLPFVDSFVFRRINNLPNVAYEGVRTFIKEIPSKISNKVDNMSPEEKEEKILELRKMVQQLKPFIDEVSVLLDDENLKLLNANQDSARVDIDK